MDQVRYALRSLRRTPLFTLLAVLTLGLGIGGTSAVFSIVHAVLLRPLPYPDADRIVMISEANARTRTMGVSFPNFEDWHAEARGFRALAAWTGGRGTVIGGQEPVMTGIFRVTHDFFDVFDVPPLLGRTFVEEELVLHGRPAVVVGHGLWQRVLGGRTDLTGLTLRVDGEAAAVVGVMPPGFAYPDGAEVWTAKARVPDASGRTAHNLRVVARLGPDVPLAQAQSEMSAIAARLEAAHGDNHDGTDAAVVPLQERLVGASRPLLLTLLGAVVVVLLGACVNVASMLVARSADRRKELAVRLALGAGRGQLVRLLLTENVLLGVAGGVLGLGLAGALVRALVALAPPQLPRLAEVSLDGPVVLFGLAVALLTPLAFGVWPALQCSRPDLRDAMVESGRGMAAGGRARTRLVLVGIEVALAVLLVCGSALLVRSFVQLLSVDPGFRPAGVVTMQTTVPVEAETGAASAAAFYEAWLARAASVPGIEAAGLINTPPLSGMDANGAFLHDGQAWEEIRADWTAQSASYRVVSGEYFRAMGIPLVRGRAFDARDVAGAEYVAVINQTMAARYFAGRDPIGARIQFAGMDRDNPPLTIVGIAGDVRHRLASDAVPEVYVHFPQRPDRMAWFVTTVARLQPGVTAAVVAPRLREAARAINPDVPAELSTLEASVGRAVADQRFAVWLLTGFGALALLLAVMGIYGVLAQTVAARTPEIGVRMALGAAPSSVVSLVLRDTIGAVTLGAAAGLAAALWLSRLAGSLLYEVSASDPAAYAGGLLVLLTAAALAGLVPARRATRIDPAIAMRAE
ncbi:MAG: ABC transporter permease [Vicinamibacterales bacterium]|nr:ABC transporter permease [Vicinamibacterales bacterium]